MAVVSKRPQTITFTPALPADSTLGSQLAVVPTGGRSGDVVTISVLTPTTCTLSASKLTLTSVGDCMLSADQAGNSTYDAAPQKTVTIGVRWGDVQRQDRHLHVHLKSGQGIEGLRTAQPRDA